MDDSGNRSLDRYEFTKAMNDIGLHLRKAEVDALFEHFDDRMSDDGNISFDEFLLSLRVWA